MGSPPPDAASSPKPDATTSPPPDATGSPPTAATASPAPELRQPANLVCSRAVWFWTVRASWGWVLLVVGQVVYLVLDDGHRSWHVAILVLTVVVAAVHLVVMPRWRYRVHRWEVTDTAVYTQSGWLDQERRIAPLSRVQTVDTERGPLEQVFRLANVTVTTASAAGPLAIRGLDREVAEQLVRDLTLVTERSVGDAT